MTSTVISDYITHFLKEEMRQIQNKLLTQVSEDFDISLGLLYRKYSTLHINETQNVVIVRKREYNRHLLECDRCIALNAKQQRCKRSILRLDGATFCVVHRNKQPYGIYKDSP